MEDFVERLAWLRKLKNYESKREAAKNYGIGYETYKKITSGREGRNLTRDHVGKIAAHHRVSAGWLMFGEGTPEGEFSVPVRGFIAAGQEILLYDDVEAEGRLVDAILAGQEAAAFEVRGESMFPVARDGDIAFFAAPRRDIARIVGLECAVALHDGRRFFKLLERGAKQGLYDLHSYNAEPMRGVEVHEAGRLLGIRRK